MDQSTTPTTCHPPCQSAATSLTAVCVAIDGSAFTVALVATHGRTNRDDDDCGGWTTTISHHCRGTTVAHQWRCQAPFVNDAPAHPTSPFVESRRRRPLPLEWTTAICDQSWLINHRHQSRTNLTNHCCRTNQQRCHVDEELLIVADPIMDAASPTAQPPPVRHQRTCRPMLPITIM